MSRASVGDVYAKVINDVCDHSRQDFEEGGVELATLDLLKSEWQKKLSMLKVAQLPWDPQPMPFKEPTPLPSNAKPIPQTLPSNGPIDTPPSGTPTIPLAPPVKPEPNAYPMQNSPSQPYSMPSFPQGQPMTAQDRAAMNLHQSYGQRAGPQIAQLQASQSRIPMPQPGSSSQVYIKQEDQSGMQDYRSDMHSAASAPLKSSQTDGAADAHDEWKAEYSRRKALMREQLLASQHSLEGGGLLLPLDERRTPNMSNLGKAGLGPIPGSESQACFSSRSRAQGDAPGDDDDRIEADEDAINSDLDDSDDDAARDEEGENTDQVMLCTYDKVQRVKNKWKCTLKDGVLRVEGNEYVFHKGQGEFEW